MSAVTGQENGGAVMPQRQREQAAPMPIFNVYGFGRYLGQTTTVATAEEAARQIAQERGLRWDRLTAHEVKP